MCHFLGWALTVSMTWVVLAHGHELLLFLGDGWHKLFGIKLASPKHPLFLIGHWPCSLWSVHLCWWLFLADRVFNG